MPPVIDTHCHASQYWFEPVEILLNEMERAGVDQAVLTQFFGVFDNSYLVEAVKRFPGRFAVIAIVDHTQPDATDRVVELHDQGVDGLRFNCGFRSPGDDPLALWRKCAELGVTASVMGTCEQYADPEFEGDHPGVSESERYHGAPSRSGGVLGTRACGRRDSDGGVPAGVGAVQVFQRVRQGSRIGRVLPEADAVPTADPVRKRAAADRDGGVGVRRRPTDVGQRLPAIGESRGLPQRVAVSDGADRLSEHGVQGHGVWGDSSQTVGVQISGTIVEEQHGGE